VGKWKGKDWESIMRQFDSDRRLKIGIDKWEITRDTRIHTIASGIVGAGKTTLTNTLDLHLCGGIKIELPDGRCSL